MTKKYNFLQFSTFIVLIGILNGIGTLIPSTIRAETPAPFIHWGALSYPDQEPALELGLSLFRFTEFNGEGERFNGINETIGINFVTLTWSEHFTNTFENWSTNFTLGIGPTRNQPTEWLQNDLIHDGLWGIEPVPVGNKRKQTDFSISGSLTRWWALAGQKRILYLSGGIQSGSLFHEAFARTGFRRWSPLHTFEFFKGKQDGIVADLIRPLRFSGMVRAARIETGAAFHDLANTAYTAQGSISYGWYDKQTLHPWFEVELGATIDSGIFNGVLGDSLEERFWTAAIRAYPFTFETWNDQLNSKDYGPTYGARLTMDLYFLLPDSWKNP
jgi:hypothetical protein